MGGRTKLAEENKYKHSPGGFGQRGCVCFATVEKKGRMIEQKNIEQESVLKYAGLHQGWEAKRCASFTYFFFTSSFTACWGGFAK
jgi:hypothetical protein